MIAKVSLSLVAFLLQYVLLNSHQAGRPIWIWVAPISAVLLLAGLQMSQAKSRNKSANSKLILLALLSLVLPPVIYITREWMIAPAAVINTFTNEPWYTVLIEVVFSGGWLFASILLWLRFRR